MGGRSEKQETERAMIVIGILGTFFFGIMALATVIFLSNLIIGFFFLIYRLLRYLIKGYHL